MSINSGNTRSLLLARLKRAARYDLAAAVEEGRLSAFACAVELGWRKRPENHGFGGGNKRREFHLRALDPDQLSGAQELELWMGPATSGSVFVSDEERRKAWFKHRNYLMLLLAKNSRRPYAWWRYESNLRYPGLDRERSMLYVEGLLDEVEARELLAYWREEFDRANAPGFTYLWKGRTFRGAVARRQHFQWADVPLEEAVAWTKERRRARKRIKELEAEAIKGAPDQGPPADGRG